MFMFVTHPRPRAKTTEKWPTLSSCALHTPVPNSIPFARDVTVSRCGRCNESNRGWKERAAKRRGIIVPGCPELSKSTRPNTGEGGRQPPWTVMPARVIARGESDGHAPPAAAPSRPWDARASPSRSGCPSGLAFSRDTRY